MPKNLKDSYMSLRVSTALKQKIEQIAEIQNRSLNNVAELLILRGLAAYEDDAKLIPDMTPTRIFERKSA